MTLEWMEWSYEEKDSEKEWPNDSWMREISELRVWPWFKNLPHFTLIPSFLDILEWRNWLEWSENEWDVLWMTSLLSSFSFLGIREWHPNDGMRRNEGDFGSEQKNRILICLSFCHHSVIWSSLRNVLITIILSVKSIHQSPSAEGDALIDFTHPLEWPEDNIPASFPHS